jgi:hypothetical protein
MEYHDKFGCYRIGDLKVYSKLEAIQLQTKTGIFPQWDFNDAVFSCYDWTKEPSQPILELYRERAQQLRDKYDYIIMMFSGGADSTTALESFILNDIKLDEVASFTNYKATGDKDSFLNAEIFRVSIPYIEKLREIRPDLKYRHIDLTDLTIDRFTEAATSEEWIYDVNMIVNPNSASRKSLPLKIKEWADIIHSGKKLCVLWALDKPRITYKNNKFLFSFIDLIGNGPSVSSMAGLEPYDDELFYWTPDKPEILIKQGHIIKNYMSGDVTSLPFISTQKSDLAFKEVDGVKYWLSNHGVHHLIYPNWNINTFTNGKTPSAIFTLRDDWFFDIEIENPVRKHWKAGLDLMWSTLPDFWKNDPSDISKGIKGSLSRGYILG